MGSHSWQIASPRSAFTNSVMLHILVAVALHSSWLTVISITRSLRPIVQTKAHKSRIITYCMLLHICPTTSFCEIYCTVFSISNVFTGLGSRLRLKLFLCTTLEAMWNRQQKGMSRGRLWNQEREVMAPPMGHYVHSKLCRWDIEPMRDCVSLYYPLVGMSAMSHPCWSP